MTAKSTESGHVGARVSLKVRVGCGNEEAGARGETGGGGKGTRGGGAHSNVWARSPWTHEWRITVFAIECTTTMHNCAHLTDKMTSHKQDSPLTLFCFRA